VSVFSPLKGFYRRALAAQEIQSDSSPVGKIAFLNCYSKARELAMVELIIKPGWKAAGLWPVNLSKPLLNPFVARPFLVPLTPEKIGMKRKGALDQGLSTPRASHQVREMVRNFLDNKQIDPTARLLFRKICKGLDEQNVQISINATKIQKLEAQNQRLQPKKRARVIEDPNSRFVRIDQIKTAQQKAAARLNVT
jgi:hypothetical protein